MVVDVNRTARIAVEKPRSSQRPPLTGRVLSLAKRIWHALVIAFSGPGLGEESGGIDDSAMPSGFMAPYKRGSRQVRNLWHQPF